MSLILDEDAKVSGPLVFNVDWLRKQLAEEREIRRAAESLCTKYAGLIGALTEELAVLKGDRLRPRDGSEIAHIVMADITAQVEYDYQAAEEANNDVESPTVGPGCAEEITPINVYLNGRWCSVEDMHAALDFDRLVQAIRDGREA